jgi:hypothetical protein
VDGLGRVAAKERFSVSIRMLIRLFAFLLLVLVALSQMYGDDQREIRSNDLYQLAVLPGGLVVPIGWTRSLHSHGNLKPIAHGGNGCTFNIGGTFWILPAS